MTPTNQTGIQNMAPLDLPRVENPPVVTAVPESPPVPTVVEPIPDKPSPKPEKPAPLPDRANRENPLVTVIAWIARFIVGVYMICNFFPLSFITAIAAFGWLQRRMQAIAVRGWWRQSPRRFEGTFQDFCDTLGDGAPVERPRWFWRENIVKYLNRPQRTGAIGKFFDTLVTFLTLPIHSLWLNFKVGIAGLLSTYMLTGWPCSIMLFSWYFGWLNSFHKGYEDAFLGLGFGLFGSFLLILTLVYVPMAQAHQAATGEIAAFFQFRVVIRLILTRLTAYVMLLAGLALTSLVFEIPRLMTAGEDFRPNLAATPQEAYWLLSQHFFIWSIFFFFALLVLRTVSALIYRSAMLKAVHAGTIRTTDLPPRLALWFEKLEILPQAQLPQPMIWTMLRAMIGFNWRTFLFAGLFVILLLFVMRFYLGYFLVFNEYRGILNHPVVQVPCIDWTPWHLVMGREE
jgi:hypothetical protein